MKQTQIDRINKEIVNIETNIEDIKSHLEDEIDVSEFVDLSEKVDELKKEYDKISLDDVNVVLTSVAEVTEKFKDIETVDVDDLKEKLNFKDLNKNIDKVNKSIEKIKAILDKEDENDSEDDDNDGK